MQRVDIKNLSFSYGNIKVFDNFNLSISTGCLTTILGKNASGKTTLARILTGSLKYKGNINIPKNIGFIEEDLDYNYDMVMDLLVSKIKNFKKNDIQKRIFNISVEFNFSKYLDMKLNELSWLEKKLIVLGSYLINGVEVLILDNFFEGFDRKFKTEMQKKLRRYAKKENVTIINFTSVAENILYADNIIILDDGRIVLNGSKRMVLENEEVFEENEFELPFVVSLSNKLKFYDLIDKVYFDEKKLVNDLWK